MSFQLNVRIFMLIACALLASSSSTSQAASQADISIEQHSKKIYPELLKIRRDLFDHPEISGEEKRTASVVANYLTELGLEVKTNVGGYGVVGILKGALPGKSIAWRADMDAAKFVFGNHDHGNSKVRHVCGHDVHTTIGLGIANTLSRNTETLSGTIYFLFQPAEESQKGAKAMIADGLFDFMQADEIYGAHVGPSPTGVITTSDGDLFAQSRFFRLEFEGTENSKEIINLVNGAMSSSNRVRSPEKFTNMLNTMDPDVGLGNPDSIYKNYVLFAGPAHTNVKDNQLFFFNELFTSSKQDIKIVKEALEKNIRSSEFKDRLNSISVAHEREGLNNDPELVQHASGFLKGRFGEKAMDEYLGKIPFASEDFGHFQKTVPGVYFFIGASNPEKEQISFPHMPGFEVDERVIEHGVTRFSSLIEHRLNQ